MSSLRIYPCCIYFLVAYISSLQASTGKMQATLMALDSATGSTVWTTSLDHSGHGAIR